MKGLFKMTATARATSASSYQKNSESTQADTRQAPRAWLAAAIGCTLAALSACQQTPTPPQAAAPVAPTATATAQPPAPVVPPAPASANRAPIDWAALQNAVGSYNAQTQFLRQPGINRRLRALLGVQYELVMRDLQVAGPLQQDKGVYYVTGNQAHKGGVEAVAIAMQPASDSVRVWLLHEGREQVLQEQPNAFAWPAEVQTLIQNSAARR